MKTIHVRIPWPEGLHFRPAAQIVAVSKKFRSQITVGVAGRVTEACSIIGLVMLCATLNTTLDIEVRGEDEQDAANAVAACFDAGPASSVDSLRTSGMMKARGSTTE
jgi:phosphotransferase system HPr (HPr) family protein